MQVFGNTEFYGSLIYEPNISDYDEDYSDDATLYSGANAILNIKDGTIFAVTGSVDLDDIGYNGQVIYIVNTSTLTITIGGSELAVGGIPLNVGEGANLIFIGDDFDEGPDERFNVVISGK